MKQSTPSVPFSQQLETWRKKPGKKTIGSLNEVVTEKTFAVIFLILMAIPALPIPTGGITHVFEVVVMLLALEMIVGLRTVWLPQKFLQHELSPKITNKGIPFLAQKVRWLERYSRPRLSGVMRNREFGRIIGLLVLLLTIATFIAPPFSGLDTLPALGVVLLALCMILEDGALFIAGIIVGSIGAGLTFALGASIFEGIKHIL